MQFTESDVIRVAIACHDVGRTLATHTGRNELPFWGDLSESQRNLTLAWVKHRIAFPDSSVSEQHRLWCEATAKDGWTHGEAFSKEKKIHPLLVDFSNLPVEERYRFLFFGQTVAVMVAVIRREKTAVSNGG